MENSQLRKSLLSLIDFKNKVPRYDLNLEQVTNKYHPEDDSYVKGVIYMVFAILFAAALVLLAFLIFAFFRLVCKYCGGNLDKQQEFEPSRRANFVCGLIFLAMFYVSTSTIALFGDITYL